MTLQDIAELEALKNQEFSKGWDKGYEQGRADAEDERASLLAFICKKYNIPLVAMNYTVDEWEQLKEQK